MDKKPKISCIMSVYNTEKYLDECIQSILNQTYENFEFIISDDWSTDKSKEIIKKYAKEDKRIVFLDNKKNRGIIANLNDCIDKAKWEYIAIMESDDVSCDKRFETEINELVKDEDLVLVGTNGDVINQDWLRIWYLDDYWMDLDFKKKKSNYLIKWFTFCSPSVMFKRTALDAINSKFYSNLLWDFVFYSHIILKWLKCKNINDHLIKKRDYLNALHTRKAITIEIEYYRRRMEFIKSYHIYKDDIFIYAKITYIFLKNIFQMYWVKISQKLWIYEKLRPIWWKLILHKDFINEQETKN